MSASAALANAVACAWCRRELGLPPAGRRVCESCGAAVERAPEAVAWSAPGGTRWKARRDWRTVALRQLHPLSSRLSPLRHLSDWRVDRYYERTLADRALADEWARHNLQGLDIPAGSAVLDHGCGRGRHSAFLAQLGFQVGAQDIAAHRWWRRIPQCLFQEVPPDAPRLPWRDGVFSMVFDFGVIHYMSEAQLAGFIDEVARVLAPGGYWILIEPNDESYGAPAMRRIVGRLHSLALARRLTSAAGFRELDLSYEGYFAPAVPLAVDFVRKTLSPRPYDVNDFNSSLAARTTPQRRKHWRLRMQKAR